VPDIFRKLTWTHRLAAIACALYLGLCAVSPALAQRRGAAPEVQESKEAWVVSYALVILFVGLGLFLISIPSRRDKRVRKQ
jgi:hypothetical protein